MKKFITIILISCLVLGAAFAANKGDIKAGAQLGFNSQIIKMSDGSMTSKVNINGFLLEAAGQYYVTDAVSIKAEAGVSINGKASAELTYHGSTTTMTQSESSPASFAFYAGAQYDFALAKNVTLGVGGGVDGILGKMVKEDSEDTFNFGFGIAAEVVASYSVNKNIDVLVGGKFAWRFVNTNEHFNEDGISTTGFGIQAFAGATYAF